MWKDGIEASMIKELPFIELSQKSKSDLKLYMAERVDEARSAYSHIEPFYEFINCSQLQYEPPKQYNSDLWSLH
jgi:hypothetical protein